MTTNRVRKGVIRGRMAASGESYVVAARRMAVPRGAKAPDAQTAAALRTRYWEPAESLDLPCPCGGTCAPGERCARCHATFRHVARVPGSRVDVEAWQDRYDCTGCAATHSFVVTLPDRPWGVVRTIPQRAGRDPIVRVEPFEGIGHPDPPR
ncbi:hypothetical protein [Embleya hyalina]|uniref:Uncharacterized protein n=1 Tax=Embleya hyalina TaxID=516124 RepID=A0A401YGG2_9ACTN|nr:hypothetical protein [Embleya hyalina]GCD93692.1 hypothetical protein EHYA_01337 [Embleya hyalina]